MIPDAPPAWLFSRSKIEQLEDPVVLKQLPRSYRAFVSWLGRRYEAQPDARIVRGGGHLFLLAKLLSARAGISNYGLSFLGYDVRFNLADARFAAALAEVKSGDVRAFLSQFISEGDTFVDIGANQGAYSIVGSHIVGSAGTVVSVEPQTALTDVVKESLRAAPATNWSILNVAMGDTAGELDFYVSKHYSGKAGLHKGWSGTGDVNRYVVPIVRFDDSVEWRGFTGRVLVKLDCEGAELQVLKGASEMIHACRPLIYMEVNPRAMAAAGTTLDNLRAQLTSLGYEAFETPEALGQRKPLESLHIEHQYDVVLRDEA